ncbi:MAG: hypothetical protein WCD81_00465 [Candidatus Bathyarchaeia archaeon]
MLLTIVILAVSIASAVSYLRPKPQPRFSLNAAIVDQLAEEIPNPTFVNNAETILENHGFKVMYYNETDVNFFGKLAENDYGIIILRAHSALREPNNSTVDLFTSEPYDSSAYVEDQQNELLVEGFLNYSNGVKNYFAITSKFIDSLEGTFPQSIVIAMGCNTLVLGKEQLAEAFINKGAKAYIGWDGYVGDSDTDSQTIQLLTNLLTYNETLDEAVNGGGGLWDITYGSKMAYYPSAAGDLTISSLAANIPTTSQLQSTLLTRPLEAKPDPVSKRLKYLRSSLMQIDSSVA